jgi:hypothetical protein
MTSISERYLREIGAQWGYLATWLPSRTVELGQSGRFDGVQVHVDGHIGDDGLPVVASQDRNTTDLEYGTSKAVSIDWIAGASTVIGDRAELEIAFSRANAVVLHIHEGVEHRVANLSEIKRGILALDARSGWDRKRAVIVSAVAAARATVLISSGRGGSVRCEAAVGEALGNLADPRLALRRTARKSMHTTIIAEGHLTPIYQALVLRKGLLGSPSLEGALRGPETMDAGDPLREAIDDDFALCALSSEPPADDVRS